MTHRHGEAFCLMWYRCRTCPHAERIWNSRDGVTPFGCTCPSCGGSMFHDDWKSDQRAPSHVLHRGQKFWRDGTPDEAEKIMRARIEIIRKSEPVSVARAKKLVAWARDGREGEFQPGWPMLDVWLPRP